MHVLGNPKFFGLVYVVYVSFSCFVFRLYLHALRPPFPRICKDFMSLLFLCSWCRWCIVNQLTGSTIITKHVRCYIL